MNRIGIRELRDTLTATVRRVRAGESFEVTHDGVPVALLVPTQKSRIDELIAQGLATPATRELEFPLTPFEAGPGKSASEILQEGREDRF